MQLADTRISIGVVNYHNICHTTSKENKLKLGQVGVGSSAMSLFIAQNHSSSLQGVISGHYCTNLHEYLTKSEIRSIWTRFEHWSNSLFYSIGSHIRSLFAPNSHANLSKSEIG